MGWLIENHDDADKMVLATTADKRDLDALADHCAAMRAIGAGNGKDDKLAMTVDGWVINDWCVKKGITFAEFMRDRKIQTRFIEDPDNAAFRIWEGKL
jgi:hypothetical protein